MLWCPHDVSRSCRCRFVGRISTPPVAIGKGWIKAFVLDDDFIRTHLEETIENVAHFMLLLTALTGRAGRA